MSTVYADSVVQGLRMVDKSAIVRGNPVIDLRQLIFLFFSRKERHIIEQKKKGRMKIKRYLLFYFNLEHSMA